MQAIILAAFFGALIWIIFNFGIEPALAIAALVSGVVWFTYRLIKGKPKHNETLPDYAEYARSFFPIFLIVLLLRGFVVEPFRIPSGSMMPTLLVGDFILVNKFTYGIRLPVTKTKIIEVNDPERGDVVVFRWPINPRLDYIKRLIGLPGDKVAYRNKTIYLNGQPVKMKPVGAYTPIGSGMRSMGAFEAIENLEGVEHSVLIDPLTADFSPGCTFMGYNEVEVPAGHYLMMGDNRDNSNDGRCWGFVPEENLVGEAFFVWLSWDWERSGFVGWDRIATTIN